MQSKTPSREDAKRDKRDKRDNRCGTMGYSCHAYYSKCDKRDRLELSQLEFHQMELGLAISLRHQRSLPF